MVMQAPIRRRLSLRGAPGVVSEDQAFSPHQVPMDVVDPKQAAWNERQWRELGHYTQGLEARLKAQGEAGGGADLEPRVAALEAAVLELDARVAALETAVPVDTWDAP
jgi:hypothetical protein